MTTPRELRPEDFAGKTISRFKSGNQMEPWQFWFSDGSVLALLWTFGGFYVQDIPCEPDKPQTTINDTFGLSDLTTELTLDEGRRALPYPDTKGNISIGIGRNLAGRGISEPEIDVLFANDLAECCATMDQNIPWWRTLPPAKQRVMINLCFMGWGSFSQFHLLFAAMQRQDWPEAARQIENSQWYGQVRDRGPRVVGRLLGQETAASNPKVPEPAKMFPHSYTTLPTTVTEP